MNILLTGANGFLGTGIAEALKQMGHNVVATDIVTNNITAQVKKVDADIFNVDDPFEYFGQPDAVLHLAWRDGFVHNSDTHINDFPHHYSFLKKLIDSGIKKVVVMGSMHEIGFYEGSIDENTPCNPMSLYGIAKNSLREVVQLLTKQKNVDFQWLRGFYIVKNTVNGNSIFSKIAAAEAENKDEFPFTTGQNQYDFLDYDEFAFRVAAAVSQNEINGIINICSGIPIKLAERVEGYIKENNFKIKLKYGAFPDRPYDSKAIWGNSKKIDTILSRL